MKMSNDRFMEPGPARLGSASGVCNKYHILRHTKTGQPGPVHPVRLELFVLIRILFNYHHAVIFLFLFFLKIFFFIKNELRVRFFSLLVET